MSFLDDFQANLESLPTILQKKYALLRDLDKSLQEIQRQNEQRCEQEIEEIKQGVKVGNIKPDSSLVRFSDEALDEQKHSIRIADEKVAMAVQAYDLVN
uniref:PHD finger protein ING n=1 Tax=Rhizophora mucronata TaxID=61149 RepID=A0A2P2JQF1_RHIMU